MSVLRSPHLIAELDPDRGGELRVIAAPGGDNVLAWHDWHAPLSSDEEGRLLRTGDARAQPSLRIVRQGRAQEMPQADLRLLRRIQPRVLHAFIAYAKHHPQHGNDEEPVTHVDRHRRAR